jgi:hypothetical protein
MRPSDLANSDNIVVLSAAAAAAAAHYVTSLPQVTEEPLLT